MTIDLNLDRISILLRHLCPYTRPTLHVAGTNGKGSVSALLSSILINADPPLHVGRFNSPHLASIHDCITINDAPVSASLFDTVRAQVEHADETHRTGLSSFEILTLVALQIFQQSQTDIVVLEVGMGGRLDATNVVPDHAIALSILTAVDLDHQAFLGNTVAKIAQEKAAIARPGRPFVLANQAHPEVIETVKAVLTRLSAGPLVDAIPVHPRQWCEPIDGIPPPPFSLSPFHPPAPQPVSANLPCFPEPLNALLPLHGARQIDNLGTSLTAINELLSSPALQWLSTTLNLKDRITPTTISRGIQSAKWPGRLSIHTIPLQPPFTDPLVLLVDGAHNPSSAETLSDHLTHLLHHHNDNILTASPAFQITYILALSHAPPKTPKDTLSPILPPNLPPGLTAQTTVILLPFTAPTGMPWVRPVPPEEVGEVVRGLMPDAEIRIESDLGDLASEGKNGALASALRFCGRRREEGVGEGLVVLAGSLYLVADFYRIYG